MLNSVGFSPLINKPTRVFRAEGCSQVSSSCLDHILTNDYENFSDAGILISDVSDHLPIFGNLQVSNPKQNLKEKISKRSFPEHKKDRFVQLLTEELSNLDFQECANTIMTKIMNALQKVLDSIFPMKNLSRKRKKLLQNPWITKEILKVMKIRDKLYRKFVKNDRLLNSVDHVNYKKARNKVNRAIKIAKDNYFQKKFGDCHGDTRKMWKVLNNAMKRKSRKSILPNFVSVKNTDGKLIKTNCKKSIADSMNQHFSTIGKKLANKLQSTNVKFSDYLKNPNPKSFFLYEAEQVEVKNLIFELILGKSVGIDDNPPIVIKWGEPILTPVLTKLFNKCIAEGVYPDFLKIAKVIPIFKGGEINEENSYRPISILTQINKIFEKLLHKRLYSFIAPVCTQNNLVFSQKILPIMLF